MAEADPILIGLSGAVFLIPAEAGGLIQSFSRSTERTKINVYNSSVGYTTGLVFHDALANYNIKIITLTTNNGLTAASPGVALTLAGITTGNGVSAGGIYCLQPTLDHTGGQLQEYTITAVQYPGIN